MSSVAFIIIRVAPAGRTLLLYFVFQINKQTNKQTNKSPPCESAGAAAIISILFLETLCSKKWCGIHSLQWSTIPRIGRHSAGYS